VWGNQVKGEKKRRRGAEEGCSVVWNEAKGEGAKTYRCCGLAWGRQSGYSEHERGRQVMVTELGRVREKRGGPSYVSDGGTPPAVLRRLLSTQRKGKWLGGCRGLSSMLHKKTR